MRYAVPVNAAYEVSKLAAAGATELYLGYQDAWWTKRYGNHDSASRRQGSANLYTPDELKATTHAACEHGLPVWLALNSRYTEPQLDYLVDLCAQFEQIGGTGVIVSDLGLLWRLREGCGLARCLSILAVAQNAPTLRAFARLGVTRVVLPRFMQPNEAADLLQHLPGMEAEVMAFFDKCPWVDGYCRHRHGVTYVPRESAGRGNDGAPLYSFDTTYQVHACLGKACTYLEPSPCAACHLPLFERAGVAIAKLGGRGRPLDERLRALRFLRAAEQLASDAERQALYRQTFAGACACYYGKATQRRDAIEPLPQPWQAFAWQGMHRGQSADTSRGTLADACAPLLLRHQGSDLAQRMGSQTSTKTFWQAVAEIYHDEKMRATPMTLLMPPLSDRGLRRFCTLLSALDARHGETLTLCVNDLGTLISLVHERVHHGYAYALAIGTLLARVDDAREVAHALSAEENPPRPVWGREGEPRLLTYRRPPDTLVRHWQSPSLLEPSAQAAVRALCNDFSSGI